MNERRQDIESLRRFSREGEQSAFAEVVRRHFDLVFATALRKVEEPGAAQEVAQNVFTALARKAWKFAPDDSLPAWLHKTALLESKSWLRGELRRRRREQIAANLGTTMNSPDNHPSFHALLPLLDEALLSLRENDRTALLLRFYERQSLREVGIAFGVSEDTAQKRVQTALEKLAECFKRRGFRTASVVTATAALQGTATSAPASVVSTVVVAALAAAPPAVTGLGAWLAKLVSLSRVQTAAVCVALVAVTVGWQLKERHTAAEQLTHLRAQVLAAQREAAAVQTEVERLRTTFGKLEESVALADKAADQAAAAAQAFADWKKRARRQLLAADYRWDDDSPFARIPKSVLPELCKRINDVSALYPPDNLASCARELMALSVVERQAVEAVLRRHFSDIDSFLAAGMRETNRPADGRIVAATTFTFPAVQYDEIDKRVEETMAEGRRLLGEERWSLLVNLGESYPGTTHSTDLRRLLSPMVQDFEIWVEINDGGTPSFCCHYLGAGGGTERGALSMFLPQNDPNRIEGRDKFLWPDALST